VTSRLSAALSEIGGSFDDVVLRRLVEGLSDADTLCDRECRAPATTEILSSGVMSDSVKFDKRVHVDEVCLEYRLGPSDAPSFFDSSSRSTSAGARGGNVADSSEPYT